MQATCPQCQTVFKVSDENIKIADGFVRCGICKEVFNALEKNWQGAKKEPLSKTKIEPVIKAKSASASSNSTQAEASKPAVATAATPAAKQETSAEKTPAASASTSKAATPVTKKNDDASASTKPVDSSNLFDGVQSKLIPDEYRIPELHNTYSLWKEISWSTAILVLTASLFVEYTWFNRNELIRKPQLRPLITQFCVLANCDTMELRELDKIEMTSRNIYTHPNVKDALMISGSLINHAEFEQPYPSILVAFSNVRGEVIASRIFNPENYLQIKLAKLKPLAPKVSVDFNMEIQDPGKNAMTYEFSFL